MTHQIDLSDFDPYSPTSSSSSIFPSSSNSNRSPPSIPPSTSTGNYVNKGTRSTDQDPLSLFSQLELGGTSSSNGNGNSLASSAVKAQAERQSKILSDLSRQPFDAPPSSSSRVSSPPSHSHSQHSQPRPFSPPRRLSSLMDLGDHSSPPQFSPPLATSPTLEPFHPLPFDSHSHSNSGNSSGTSSAASRRMRQASGEWKKSTSTIEEDATMTMRRKKTREKSLSGEWGDFQTATPLSTSPPPSSTSPIPEPSARSKPSPRRSSTTPLAPSSSKPPIPTSASSLSAYDLKNLPAPPSAPNSVFDPFSQPVRLLGVRSGISQILNETIAESLRPSLPPRLRISSTWKLLYSLDRDGTSLLTLFKKVEIGLKSGSNTGGGFVLIVRTEKGKVFGAYVSEAFRSDSSTEMGSKKSGLSSLLTGNKIWGGDGTSFLFTTLSLPPSDPRLSPLTKTFPPTYRNTYFQHASLHSGIALGGGNDGKFGLWIDERLERGWTGKCETFGNEPLTGASRNGSGQGREGEEEDGGKFELVGLECWAVGG
ncbi:Oxr1p [Sporobolomyces salmoneus]|uniref:Oxr1p n=1 Tax=Sporobolomyces salmoneus TaxID=183962 RepID=UPI00317FFC2F